MLLVDFMIAWAQVRSRYMLSPEACAALPVRMWLFPYLSIGVMIAIAVVILVMAFDPAMRSQVFATAIGVAVAAAVFVIRRATAARAPSAH